MRGGFVAGKGGGGPESTLEQDVGGKVLLPGRQGPPQFVGGGGGKQGEEGPVGRPRKRIRDLKKDGQNRPNVRV